MQCGTVNLNLQMHGHIVLITLNYFSFCPHSEQTEALFQSSLEPSACDWHGRN